MTSFELLLETSVPAAMALAVGLWAREGDNPATWPAGTLAGGLGNLGFGSVVVGLLHDTVEGSVS